MYSAEREINDIHIHLLGNLLDKLRHTQYKSVHLLPLKRINTSVSQQIFFNITSSISQASFLAHLHRSSLTNCLLGHYLNLVEGEG